MSVAASCGFGQEWNISHIKKCRDKDIEERNRMNKGKETGSE
jgi:hypothetical protein